MREIVFVVISGFYGGVRNNIDSRHVLQMTPSECLLIFIATFPSSNTFEHSQQIYSCPTFWDAVLTSSKKFFVNLLFGRSGRQKVAAPTWKKENWPKPIRTNCIHRNLQRSPRDKWSNKFHIINVTFFMFPLRRCRVLLVRNLCISIKSTKETNKKMWIIWHSTARYWDRDADCKIYRNSEECVCGIGNRIEGISHPHSSYPYIYCEFSEWTRPMAEYESRTQ